MTSSSTLSNQERIFDQRFVHRREIEAGAEHPSNFRGYKQSAAQPPRVKLGRTIYREADLASESSPSFRFFTRADFGTSSPMRCNRIFEVEPVFGLLNSGRCCSDS